VQLPEFVHQDIPNVEVERLEGVYGPLAQTVRELVDATIRTTAPAEEVALAQAELESALRRLRASELPGAAGVRYNSEGRFWDWGNAVVGLRNATALPLKIVADESGRRHAEAVLGAAQEGPPGFVHGGVQALLLDQIMGVTASNYNRLTMTGTLTIRYRRGTPLGPVRLEAWISGESERKVFVEATVADAQGVTAEATGVFIIPSWVSAAAG
jgi:acyl-coenzyme A thioesterase PaaI-like protein